MFSHCFRALDKLHIFGKDATRSRSNRRMLIAFHALIKLYNKIMTVEKHLKTTGLSL